MLNITVLRPCCNGMVSHHITTFTFDSDTSLAMMSRLKNKNSTTYSLFDSILEGPLSLLEVVFALVHCPKVAVVSEHLQHRQCT